MIVKMFHILILLRALLANGVQTISIDSQLGTSVEDCFERISIGEKLSFDAIYRNVSELTSLECEHLCKQDRQCQIYVYGVGAKGNATCEVSNLSENEARENRLLMRHPDYDIYTRRVQCEQAPPIPIQVSLNDPPPEPAHRPIFRPEIDEPKRPAADFPDLRPFETKPDFYSPYKPNDNHLDDKPDSCHDSKPVFDNPPSYGDHRPQDTPYRPYTKPKPNPYDDVLHFQDQYGRPPYHLGTNYPPPFYGNDNYGQKPEGPYRPPSYIPDEKPQFVYVQRPNKKPKPQGSDYNKPIDNYPSYTNYEQNQGYGPIGPPPRPFRPFRPYNEPSRPYDYHGQYASGYGGQYQESHWEHYPTRPYRPSRPLYDRPSDGYEEHQHGYGSSYGNNDFPSQNQYGSSGNPVNNKYNATQPNKPEILNDDSHNSYVGTSQSNHQLGHYGSHYDKPSEKPISNIQQGSYDMFQGYGSSQSSNTNNQYNFNSKPPSYDSTVSHQDDYRPQFDNTFPHYGSPSTSNIPSYGSNIPYGNKPEDFNDDRPHRPSYGIKPSQNRPSYDDPQFSYGSNVNNIPSTNYKPEVKPTTVKPLDYDRPDPQYGPPPYGSQDDGTDDEGYKNSKKPAKQASETNHRHTDIKPVYEYELDRPNNAPSFTRPGGHVVTSKPVAVGDYGRPDRQPGFVVSYKACFRRVLAGKRALRSFVRRVAPCERLEDCRRECAEERTFHCESFNYRLDPTFRGKGICELMTRPIESFDLRRDFVEDKNYDFYEVDRNSLEPYCPETLRGPGLLHSGYLSSKPSGAGPMIGPSGVGPSGIGPSGFGPSGFGPSRDRWRDRNDWAGWHDKRRYYDRIPPHSYQRRYEDQFYVPYQIGLPSHSRSNDEDELPIPHNSYYGGYNTYYKDRNDYHKSINHWGLNDVIPPTAVRPYRPDFSYQDLGKTYHNHDKTYRDHDKTYHDHDKTYHDHDKTYHDHDETYHDLGKTYHDLEKHGPNIYKYGYGSWKRGRWNTSGSAGSTNGLDYGESTYYKPPKKIYEHVHDEDVTVKDCSPRRRPGMSLSSGAIRRSLIALNVVECEAACFNEREFKCVSYSFRYSSSHGTDNCFLSERPYRGLELSADSGSDVYAMPQGHGCVVSQKAFVESECFWHVRSGAAVSEAAVRAALTVAGLGACEAECIRASGFFCRGFSFRFDSPTIGDDLENCILTSSPPTALDIGRGLRASTGHELYARGNYGRGCEPALYDDVHPSESGECYLQYDNAAKLIGRAVRGQARVKDEQSCGAACTDAPFRCLSFSYNNNAPPDVDNCFLSEVRLFDLQRGVDYEHSTDDWLFAFDLFNSACWRKVHGRENPDPAEEPPHPPPIAPPGDIHPSEPSGPHKYLPAPPEPSYIPGPPSGPDHSHSPRYPPPHKPYPGRPPYEPPVEPPHTRPGYLPESPHTRPGYLPEPPHTRPGFLPERPIYRPEPGYPGSGPGLKPGYPEPGYGPPGHEYPVGPSGPGYRPDPGLRPGFPPRPVPERPLYPGDREEEPIAVSWRHYTVSGLPCRQGTTCAQNQVAGHWACEPEGGEIGAWDYCCAPTHRCGYSEGFHKPWCYVGPSDDQWRPCSEKYYPYHQHNIPHPSQGHRRGDGHRPPPRRPYRPGYPGDRDRPDPTYLSEEDRRYWDDLYKNGPRAYYDKYGNPLPGYSRVPMESPPYIKYHHNYPRPGSGQWVPVSPHPYQGEDPPLPGGLGAPRYWPVAYLHKGPPPNMTYFRYNDTTNDQPTTTERYSQPEPPRERPSQPFNNINPDRPNGNSVDRNNRDEKNRNMTMTNTNDDEFNVDVDKSKDNTTTPKSDLKENITEAIKDVTDKQKDEKTKDAEVKMIAPENVKMDNDAEKVKGVSGKIDDFSGSIEVLNIEDAKKGEKLADLKTLEAEERQIEAIGRLLASRRDGKLILEKRSQKDLEAKSIAVDRDLADFNIANKFTTTERRGIIQKVTKEEIEKERNIDKSLEVSETTFVRPPRVLSTTESIRKALVNGKVFYDAMLRDHKDLTVNSNSTRRPKSLRPLEERAPSVIQNATYGKKKNVRARNVNPVNPVRKVRRVYRRKYNPEEVRRRLLEREKNKKGISTDSSKI